MAAVAKKNGKINAKDYQSDQFCKQLAPLVARLNAELSDVKLDAKSLGLTAAQVLQFQEDALGVNSLPPRDFPKLPIQLFEDVRPGGGLAIIAARLAAIKRSTPQLKAFEWSNPGSRRFNLENLQIIRADLIRAGLLKIPVVAAHPSCSADKQRALEAAGKLGASVVEDPADPSVTHVLYPIGALCIAADDPASQMRTLQTSAQRARVHWRFLPDSYAEWVPLRSAPTPGAERSEPPGGKLPWRVTLQWVLDSEKYNEWMHPQDYEADEAKAKSVAAAEAAAAEGVARAAAAPGASAAQLEAQDAALVGAKRVRGGDKEVDEAGPGAQVSPGVFKRRTTNPHCPVVEGTTAAENVSQGQLDHAAPVPVIASPGRQQQQQQQLEDAAGGGAVMPAGSGEAEGRHASMAAHRYVMPMHAHWFGFNSIHNHERRALPELFNSCVPGFNISTYTALRNGLVSLYRCQPERRLTLADARDAMSQYDPHVLERVFAFLEGWGIINWLAAPNEPPPTASLPAGTRLAGPAAAQRCPRLPAGLTISARGAAGSAQLQRGARARSLLQLRAPSTAEGVAAACGGGTLLTMARDARGGRLEPSTSLAAGRRRYFCSAMPGVECTALRYQCVKHPDVTLCPEAYAQGCFPPGTCATDFVRLEGGADDASDASAAGKWTPQETLLLLEGLDMHGDQWPSVAEHVGTHTVLECIIRFLQLPIEDDFLDELEQRGLQHGAPSGAAAAARPASPGVAATADVHGDAVGRVPMAGRGSTQGNPVMSLVTLASVMLAPRIASEAAQAALEAFASDDPLQRAAAIQAARRGAGAAHDAGAAVAPPSANAQDGGDGALEPPATPPDPAGAIPPAHARAAAALALAAAAVRAKCMADEQEAEIERLVQAVTKAQLTRVRTKLKYLQEINQALDSKAREHLEAAQEPLTGGQAKKKRA